MKKKILTGLLTLAMLMTTGITTFAADGNSMTDEGTGEKTIDVTASYQPADSESDPVYSVDIIWENMNFEYADSGEKVWNPETHTYSSATEGRWDRTEANITVINHSNVAVNIVIAYIPTSTANTGITGTITKASATLQAGELEKPDEADSMTTTLKISGRPNDSVTKYGVKIGTITIQIL